MASRAQIAKLHIAAKELGLEKDDYRAVLRRATGASSAKELSEQQADAALAEFRRLGWSGGPPRVAADGPYTGKLRALWISGWHLGVVRDRSDKAMLAFVKRQTGIDQTRFLHRSQDAVKAVEALKSMLARAGGVDWGAHDNPRRCVVLAQFARLVETGGFTPFAGALHRSDIESYGYKVTGKAGFAFYGDADWDRLIAAAGARLRAALAKLEAG